MGRPSNDVERLIVLFRHALRGRPQGKGRRRDDIPEHLRVLQRRPYPLILDMQGPGDELVATLQGRIRRLLRDDKAIVAAAGLTPSEVDALQAVLGGQHVAEYAREVARGPSSLRALLVDAAERLASAVVARENDPLADLGYGGGNPDDVVTSVVDIICGRGSCGDAARDELRSTVLRLAARVLQRLPERDAEAAMVLLGQWHLDDSEPPRVVRRPATDRTPLTEVRSRLDRWSQDSRWTSDRERRLVLLLSDLIRRALDEGDEPGEHHRFCPAQVLPTRPPTVARREAVEKVLRLVGPRRVVNVVGPPGVGKTALATEVAWRMHADIGEVLWLSLDRLRTRSVFWEFVMAQLALNPPVDRPPDRHIVEFFRDRPVALVLDNCEHLMIECRQLMQTVTQSCEAVRIISTTHEYLRDQSLGVDVPLEGLAIPTEEEKGTRTGAVQFFCDAVRARRPDFDPTSATELVLIVRICRQLDGLPLALELAASYVGVLTLQEIVEGVTSHKLELSQRGGNERHRSLEAAIQWSVDALDESLRDLFSVIGAFTNGCRVDALAEMEGGSRPELARRLRDLEDRSMLQIVDGRNRISGPRLHLLDSLASYAKVLFERRADQERIRCRHAEVHAAWIAELEPALRGAEQLEALSAVDLDHENLLAAIRWAHRKRDDVTAFTATGALWRYWRVRGLGSEALELLDQLLADLPEHTVHRGRALCCAGNLTYWQRQPQRAIALLNEAFKVAEATGDWEWGEPFSLLVSGIASLDLEEPDVDGAEERLHDALDRWEALLDATGTYLCLFHLARCARHRGHLHLARGLEERCEAVLEMHDDLWAAARCSYGLGLRAEEDGRLDRASELLWKSLPTWRHLNDREGIAGCLVSLARLNLRSSPDTAITLLREALSLEADLRVIDRASEALEISARLLDLKGRHPEAVTVAAASLRCRAFLGARRERHRYEDELKRGLEAFSLLGPSVMALSRRGENQVAPRADGTLDPTEALRFAHRALVDLGG